MKSRSGGELLVDCLVALGATKSFGVPGESYLAVLDALHDKVGTLDYVLCRNEGGAAFMAAAYGKLIGSPGICFVTRGPGATNASIGVHTARQDSVPMLLFVGQVGTASRGREAFQEVDYRSVFGTLAKWVVEIDEAERIPELLGRAWTTAVSGRPGPVVVALPEDMLSGLTSAPPLSGPTAIPEPCPSPEAIERTLSMLAAAARPLILIGGCSWSDAGSAALQRFAEASNVPVVAAFRYQDRFDNGSAVFCGEAGVGMPPHVSRLLREADTLLAIGVRFGEITTAGYSLLSVPEPAQRLIHVHASELEIGKIYQPALGIQAGCNAFAAALSPLTGGWQDWRREGHEAYEDAFELPEQPSPVDMGKVCAWLRERLPEDVIITNGAGNFTVWPNRFLRFGRAARLLAPQSGAMGYGLPAAIAAKVACPERTVVCFAGDGDFQMNCSELGTALQAGAQPIVLILDNGIYGTIRAHQERHYPARVFGTTMTRNPDFVALAQAYGFHAERIGRTDDFAAAFERALDSDVGAVLVLEISPEALTPRLTLSELRQSGFDAQRAAGSGSRPRAGRREIRTSS